MFGAYFCSAFVRTQDGVATLIFLALNIPESVMRDESLCGKKAAIYEFDRSHAVQVGAGFAAKVDGQAQHDHALATIVDDGDRGLDMETLARLTEAIARTPLVAVQGFDRDGNILAWNDASAKLYGISRKDAIGRRFTDLVHFEDDGHDFMAILATIWDSRQPSAARDWKIVAATGKVVWVYSSMFPVVEHGNTQQVFCMDVDITQRKDHEQRLLAGETRFREFFEKSIDAIILLRNGEFNEFNPAALRLFGYDGQHNGLKGMVPHKVSPKRQPDGRLSREKMEEMHAIVRAKGSHRFEWQYCNRDHHAFWGEATVTAVETNGETLYYAVVRDISARKEAERALRLSARVFESSHESIMILDSEWRILSVNDAFVAMTGLVAQQVVGEHGSLLKSTLYEQAAYETIGEELTRSDYWHGEVLMQHVDRQAFPAWASVSVVRDDDGKICNYIAIMTDISERKASEERIRHLSEHDFLTGLPNRVLLLDRLQQAIAAARRNRSKLAVLFLDLDRFKNVNDSLGHHVGDRLLQAVAERLKKCVRGNDTVSRQGGDEFIVMLADIGGVEQVAHIAGNILQTINMPYQIDEYALTTSTCIGISVYPEDGQDIDALIKNADTAMYHAKENGRNSYQFFNRDMNMRIVEQLMLENYLKSALEQNQFSLQYQPELDIVSGHVLGVEALLRWQHPQAGLLTPEHFLSVAEECGLIVPIGDWVLRTACRQARSWHDQGMPLKIGVNLSAIQFRQKDFVQKVAAVLQQTGLAPQFLELEITESILIDSTVTVLDTMHRLRAMGVVLAVDDFGTGYSSLSYLKHFPVDKLKIDQSFVHDLNDDDNDAAIIRAILIMAKSLKLRVIAEGVETMEQLAFLQSQGCDEYQGYYAAHPLLPADLPQYFQIH